MQLYTKKMHIYSLMHFNHLESKHSSFHMHMCIQYCISQQYEPTLLWETPHGLGEKEWKGIAKVSPAPVKIACTINLTAMAGYFYMKLIEGIRVKSMHFLFILLEHFKTGLFFSPPNSFKHSTVPERNLNSGCPNQTFIGNSKRQFAMTALTVIYSTALYRQVYFDRSNNQDFHHYSS